jgi:DNA-binding NarL/FixJ family response regulator
MSTSATRVVLADDEVLMREGLAGLLERSGFEVVGQSGNASELIELVRELRSDVIVDIRVPPTHTTEGLEAGERIREEFPDIAVVALSAHAQVEGATALLATGERARERQQEPASARASQPFSIWVTQSGVLQGVS